MFERILVVDDDAALLKSLKKLLRLNDYIVDTISNPTQVKSQMKKEQYQCVLLDVKMPGINGLDLLKIVLTEYPLIPAILISGQSNIQIAVEALKNGAYDFIEKPIEPDRLLVTIKNAIYQRGLQQEKNNIFDQLQKKFRMIGKSEALINVFKQIHKVANSKAKVLITGESGTGKELVAWAIHYNSRRSGKPYIKLNCAAIPSELLESELFGHKKGAFTGATADRRGKFEAADGGTLFLDEIGDMSLNLQAKLLRAIEQYEINVLGDNIPKTVNIRLIAATNQNLEQLIKEGKFREDLFYRLNVVQIALPPLRERIEDISPLAYYFLAQFNEEHNKQVLTITRQAQFILMNYSWPGNVRELRNKIERLVLQTNSNEIGINDVQKAFKKLVSPLIESVDKQDRKIIPLKSAAIDFERKYIVMCLNQFNWKINETANALGIDRSNLFKKMRKLGIKKEQFVKHQISLKRSQ